MLRKGPTSLLEVGPFVYSLTPQTFDLWRGNMQKGTLSCDNAPFARLFSCNLFARCP